MKIHLLLLILFTSSFSFAQDAKTYDATVPTHYFDFSLKLVKETPGFSPPVAARAFGYMGLTLYEAVVEGIPTHKTMDGLLYEFTNDALADPGKEYHWPTVANTALATITDSLFRTATAVNKDSLVAIRDYYNDKFSAEVDLQVFTDSRLLGEAIALEVYDYSKADGGHNAFAENFPASYVPPVGPDLWIPFGNQVCLQPYWGEHRPFIEDDTIEAISPPAPAFSTEPGSEFYNFAYEVYNTGINLTPEQTTIAQYWADGGGTMTPAGHSISMLTNILDAEDIDLETATIAYAKLGIALSDAFLACWKTKFIYNLCRPVTYIREYIDSTWLPLIGTPPFPEYPSGHSSQSGAMSEILTDVFGPNYAFIDSTHGANFGGPRSFDSFEEAAQEAAISRLYGGIHFPFGNLAGLELGHIVGENVNELFEALTVSTDDHHVADAGVSIYPNPVMDVMNITTQEGYDGGKFEMLDMFGRIVSQGVIDAGTTSMNISAMTPGAYLLRLHNNDLIRFIKN